jgi:hypothetical protein
MTELEDVRLGENNLSGSLPSELDQLTRLLGLDLSKNNFDGQLLMSLFKLERIGESLSLARYRDLNLAILLMY